MSSKRAKRRRGCSGKARHATQNDANYAAAKVRGSSGQLVSSYKCRFCKGWHIGHVPWKHLHERQK